MQFGMPIKNPGFIPCTVCVIGNIVVKKEYRNQGIGTHLFEYIKTIKCPEFDVCIRRSKKDAGALKRGHPAS